MLRGGGSAAPAGFSLPELVVTLGVVAVTAAVALPVLSEATAAAHTVAAARTVAAQCSEARGLAARRRRSVALRFIQMDRGWGTALVADGNGNGVRSAEVSSGIDLTVRPVQRLDGRFGEAGIRVAASVPAVDGGGLLLVGDDPVRVGPLNQLVFGPTGGGSGGTIYIGGRSGQQLAVRVLGTTGRVRVLRYMPGRRTWEPL